MSVQAILEQILALLAVVQGLLQGLNLRLSLPGWDVLLNVVPSETSQILSIVQDPDSGNAALHNQILAMSAQVDTILADVVALGTPQQAGVAVTLPSPAPAGYGGSSAADNAAAVWAQPVVMDQAATALDALVGAASFAFNTQGALGLPALDSPNLVVFGPWASNGSPGAVGAFPRVDPATILPTDATVLAWLTRVYGPVWFQFAGQPYPFTRDSTSQYSGYVFISQAEFAWIRAMNAGTGLPTPGAPVWPGLSGVTLGSSRAISPPGETVTVDCDGVIIDITGVPSWAGKFSFGTATSWRNVGAVTFSSDNGQEEFAQTFSWTSGVYLPKSQSHAAGYAYRAAVGVSGTITPFTIN